MDSLFAIGAALVTLGVIQFAFGAFCLTRASRQNLLPVYAGGTTLTVGFFCSTIGTAYLRAHLGLDYALYYRAGWVGWLAIPFMFSMFNTIRGEVSRLMSIFVWCLYPLWGAIAYLTITTNWIDMEPSSFIPYVDQGGPYEMPARQLGAFLLFCVLILMFRLRKEVTGLRRQQANYLLLGATSYVVGGGLFAGAPVGKLYVDPGLVGFASVTWVGFTLYAAMRHRLFDIRVIVSRLVTGTITVAVFTSLDFLAIKTLQGVVGLNTGIIFGAMSNLILAFAMVGTLRKWIDHFILNKTIDHQTALKKSSEALVSILNLDDLLRKFIEISRNTLGVSDAAFYLFDGKAFTLRSMVGNSQGLYTPGLAPDGALISHLNETKLVLVREEQVYNLSESKMNPISEDLLQCRAEAAVPVFYKGLLIGVLVLGHKANKDAFLQEDISFLETIASQAAIAIENARLFEEATTDGLTGLYHHKYFKARLRSEFERARRHGHNLILILADIDHFKRINDTHGHLAGDAVLKGVAKILHSSLRIEDVVARYGGEEFAILLNEPSVVGAKDAAERIRKKVELSSFDHGIRVTISMGMYVYDKESRCTSEIDLIQFADKALYQAKNSGRNRIVFFEEVSKIRRVK